MARCSLHSSVSELSGVGKTRTAQLSRLGITTVKDLVYFFPRAYEKRSDVRLLSKYDTEAPRSYLLTVATRVSNAAIRRGLTLSKFKAFDESGSIEVVFFNSPFVKDVFHVGETFRFYGKISLIKNKLQFSNPKYEPYTESSELPDFLPIYPLTTGLSSKILGKLIKEALNDVFLDIQDPLPEEIRYRNKLMTLSSALKSIHFPETEKDISQAISRLAFDEMLYFALGIAISASERRVGNGVKFSPCKLEPLTSMLPYELTNSQKSAINDIYRDTVLATKDGRTPPMARIIVGDVGSGKTICAIAAMYIAARSGAQCALMVPTEILARQHFSDASELLGGLGIKTELLLGSTSQKEKKRIYAAISDGSADVVIGTHALLSDKIDFANLGLIITDEQHRFGVNQRGVLKTRTASAHLLVMSATPIPRTLALALYGDLDVSRITEMPKGRQRIETYVVDESYRKRLNSFISNCVNEGGQCYVVCPSIEREEDTAEIFLPEGVFAVTSEKKLNLKNAVEYTEELRRALPGISVECLHGRMSAAQKDEIMTRFSKGEINVLVSTTVIEVGVNVPNATLMIVENAERFGLSQLHQLRGRVGRGTRKSYCVLVSDAKAEKATARLDVMKSTHDGYEIAERDLILRGPGDFFSSNSQDNIRQSGGFSFKLASMCDDQSLFEAAFSTAKSIAISDPKLTSRQYRPLKSELESVLSINISSIS